MKNPADFVGAVLGESEKNTKAILESTVGKVLIIDEVTKLCSITTGNNGADLPNRRICFTEELVTRTTLTKRPSLIL
jgi:hypothetical protein